MKHFNVYVMIAILLLSLPSFAKKNNSQPDHPQFKRLYIGDTVPMDSIVFNNVRNHPGGKAKLSDFKGKYIILDFWTKGCSSCIAAFPRMEELQNEFKDDIQVLLVTKNSVEEIALLSKNSVNLKNTRLPVVIGDQILATQMFPHESVPFHVWLDKEGKVVATTYPEETNVKNLKDLVAGKKLDLSVKEYNFDKELVNELQNPNISLLKVNNGSLQKYLKYYAQIPLAKIPNVTSIPKGAIPSLPYYSMFMSFLPGDIDSDNRHLINDDGKEMGLRCYNCSSNKLFQNAFSAEGEFLKIILEDDKAKQYFEDLTDTTNSTRHFINNSYCYESCMPEYSKEKARALLKQDLTRFTGLTGIVEERPIKHLVLNRLNVPAEKMLWAKNQTLTSGNTDIRKTSAGWIFKGSSLGAIFSYLYLANRSSEDPIITDETNFTLAEYHKNIDVFLKINTLKMTPENILLIKKELSKYGLGLKEEIRKRKVLVLKAVL